MPTVGIPIQSGGDQLPPDTSAYGYYSQTGTIPIGRPPKLDQGQALASFATSPGGIDYLVGHIIAHEGGSKAGVENNPGNIKFAGLPGQVDSGVRAADGGTFASYPSLAVGRAAIADLIQNAAAGNSSAYGKNPTVGSFLHVYSNGGYGTRVGSAPGWNVAPRALESEQNRSNTDVRYMTPEEFLESLPPLKDDEPTRTKRRNLNDSLAAGDDIEAIPSLDVTPRGNNLHIADWDGRNRAQAAVDAGLDQIPVSIRGVPAGQQDQFKLLVGDKKVSLPYTFAKVPQAAKPTLPISAAQQARQIVPQAFEPGPQPIAPQAIPQPTAQPISPAALAKPDFYPEIAAGVNKDIVNPLGIGYRGTGVPDLATNATAGGRIAAANAGSAGQVGLGGMLGSALSALNPIGTAQAAVSVGQPVSVGGGPALPSRATVGSPIEMGAPPDLPTGYIPGVSDVPVLGTVLPPAVNFLGAGLTGPASEILAAPGLQQPNRAARPQDALLPFSDQRAYRLLNPATMAEWSKNKAEIQAQKMMLPETPMGQAISAVLNSPATLLAGALNELASIAGATPQQREAAGAYMDLASPLLAFGGFAPGRIGNILRAPGRALLQRAAKTPEMRDVAALNKAYGQELVRNPGMAGAGNTLAELHRLGVPAAPIDVATPGGPIDTLFKHAARQSPQAKGETVRALEERAAGPETPSTTRLPAGGTRARMELAAGQTFGFHDAYEMGKEVVAKLDRAQEDRTHADRALRDLAPRLDRMAKEQAGFPPNEELRALRREGKDLLRARDRAQEEVARQTANQSGLDLGKKILSDSTRPEEFRDWAKTASPEAITHLKAGIAEKLIDLFADHPERALTLVGKNTKVQNKIIQALGGNPRAASDFIDAAKGNALMVQRGKNLLGAIRRDTTMPEWLKRGMIRTLGAATHAVSGLLFGAHLWGSKYWAIQAAQRALEYGASGGSLHPARGVGITRMLRDPNAALEGAAALSLPPGHVGRAGQPVANTLFRMPERSPDVERRINALSQLGPAIGYSMLAPRPAAPDSGP